MMIQNDPPALLTCAAAPRAHRVGASPTLQTPLSIRCTHRTWLHSRRAHFMRGTLTCMLNPAQTIMGIFFTWASRALKILQCSQSPSKGIISPQGLHELWEVRLHTCHLSSAAPHHLLFLIWILLGVPALFLVVGASEVDQEGSEGAQLQG